MTSMLPRFCFDTYRRVLMFTDACLHAMLY